MAQICETEKKHKMKKQEFYSQFSNSPKEKITPKSLIPSEVQLYPGMSLREMVTRYVNNGDPLIGSGVNLEYDEEFATPQNFDLSDLSVANELVKATQSVTKKRQNKGNAATAKEETTQEATKAAESSVPPVLPESEAKPSK